MPNKSELGHKDGKLDVVKVENQGRKLREKL